MSCYPSPCDYRPDPNSVCRAPSTSKETYMIMTCAAHRLGPTMVAYGPLLVTAMACYIQACLALPDIFCQCQAPRHNIHGREHTTLDLKYVHESFLASPKF